MTSYFRELTRLLFILGLLFIIQSCTVTKGQRSPTTPLQKPMQPTDLARQHIKAGRYQDAINEYISANQKSPMDQAVTKECIRGLEDIKKAADKKYDEKEYAPAGKTYKALLKNNIHFKAFNSRLSFDEAQLDTRLTHCKKSLSAQGFQQYREGNLNEAISAWRSLLAIDPSNDDIKAAVKTATQQQKILRERSVSQ